VDQFPGLAQYESWFQKPRFHVFNRAHTLLIIYGNTSSYFRQYDGTLAAANIMLSAYAMGIGTCWIGFSHYTLDTPEFKRKHNVPENYDLVCPMSIGYMKSTPNPPTRKEPLIFYRD